MLELAAALVEDIVTARQSEQAAPVPDRPRDPYGQWQPPPPGPQAGWHHTLRHPANRTHLLGNDPFMAELYGREPGPGRDAAQSAHRSVAGSPGASPVGQASDEELDARGLHVAARRMPPTA